MKTLKVTAIILGVVVFLLLLLPAKAIPSTPLSNYVSLTLLLLMILTIFFSKSDRIGGIIVFIVPLIIFSIEMINGGAIALMVPASFLLNFIPLLILIILGYKMIPSEKKGILILGIIGILVTVFIYSLNLIDYSMSGPEYQASYLVGTLPFVFFILIFLVIIVIGIFKIFKETKVKKLQNV